MIGLGSVDNTADTAKVIAQTQVTGLASTLSLKAPLAEPTFTGTVRADKVVAGEVDAGAGLVNVQTSFSSIQNSLSNYAPISGATFAGNVAAPRFIAGGVDLGPAVTAASTAASAAQTSAATALAMAQSALASTQSASGFSVPSGQFASDLMARDVGGVAQGKPYTNTSGQVCVSQLAPAQYSIDIGQGHDLALTGHGVSMLSRFPNGTLCDWTIEAYIYVHQLGQACLFDISTDSQKLTYGNIYGGINGGGHCYLVVGNQTFTSTVVPPTNSWCHFAWQLHSPIAPDKITVNFLFNGTVYLMGNMTATIYDNWGQNLTVAQHVNGDYNWLGQISNFRLSNQAVYVTPYTYTPKTYTMVYPLSVASSTLVLLQGKPLTNVASPSQSITFLSQFPYPMVAPLVSNLPTYGGMGFLIANSVLQPPSGVTLNTNAMNNSPWTFDVYLNILTYNTFANYGGFVMDLRPFPTDVTGGFAFVCLSGKMGIWSYNGSCWFTTLIPLGVWTHVAMMYTGSSLYLFLNGVPAGTITTPPAILTSTSQNTSMTLGNPGSQPSNYQGGSMHFSGSISQPLIRLGAQYATTGFTPTPNLASLAQAAGNKTLLFVDAVGASNTPTEMVSNTVLVSTGDSPADPRYMAY